MCLQLNRKNPRMEWLNAEAPRQKAWRLIRCHLCGGTYTLALQSPVFPEDSDASSHTPRHD